MSFERLYLEMFITVSPPPGGGGKTAIALFQQRAPDIGLARPNETKQTRFIWSRETNRHKTCPTEAMYDEQVVQIIILVIWFHNHRI